MRFTGVRGDASARVPAHASGGIEEIGALPCNESRKIKIKMQCLGTPSCSQGSLRRNGREILVNELAEMRVGSPGKESTVFGANSPRRALAEMQSPRRRYATNESTDLPDLAAAAAAGATTVDQVRRG